MALNSSLALTFGTGEMNGISTTPLSLFLERYKEGKPVFGKAAVTSDSPLDFTRVFVTKQAKSMKV